MHSGEERRYGGGTAGAKTAGMHAALAALIVMRGTSPEPLLSPPPLLQAGPEPVTVASRGSEPVADAVVAEPLPAPARVAVEIAFALAGTLAGGFLGGLAGFAIGELADPGSCRGQTWCISTGAAGLILGGALGVLPGMATGVWAGGKLTRGRGGWAPAMLGVMIGTASAIGVGALDGGRTPLTSLAFMTLPIAGGVGGYELSHAVEMESVSPVVALRPDKIEIGVRATF